MWIVGIYEMVTKRQTQITRDQLDSESILIMQGNAGV